MESGYYYCYCDIEAQDVVTYFKNTIKLESTNLNVNNGILPNKVLKSILAEYETHVNNLEEIKPSKGKKIKELVQNKESIIEMLGSLASNKCQKLELHLN